MNEPFLSLGRDNTSYKMLVLPSADSKYKDFFTHHFTNRDNRLGFPVFYERIKSTKSGTQFNFSLRELAETFFDKYSSHRFADFLQVHSIPSIEQQVIVEDIKDISKGYHYAYAIRSTGSRGKFEFWQVYVPGLTYEELKEKIPKKYQSKSKKAPKAEKPGFSPLLIQGDYNNFGDLLSKIVEQTYVSEMDYFLLKRTTARDTKFKDYLKTVSNVDRVAHNFFRKWAQPMIFFDNTSQWQAGDFDGLKVTLVFKNGEKITQTLEQYEVQEEHILDMYTVLREHEKRTEELYSLPDTEILSKKQRTHKTMGSASKETLEKILVGSMNLAKGKLVPASE